MKKRKNNVEIRLLGNDQNFKSSPIRSVYSSSKDAATGLVKLTVPIDVWFLENSPASSPLDARDIGKRRQVRNSWNDLELGVPLNERGIASFLGAPPDTQSGNVPPTASCLSKKDSSFFKKPPDELRANLAITKLPFFTRDEVKPELRIAIYKLPGKVTRAGVQHPYRYLPQSVRRIEVYQLEVWGELGYSMIGSPVIAQKSAEAPRKRLGMLIDFENQGNGKSIAFVVPAELID